MSALRSSTALALVLLVVAAVTAHSAVGRIRRQSAIAASCDAVSSGRFDEAIDRSADLVGADTAGRIAAECRCWALLATDRRDACADLLADVLDTPEASDWVPDAALAKLAIQKQRDAGRSAEAAALAARAAVAHPADVDLIHLELLTRSLEEGEEAALAALEKRLSDDDAVSLPLRVVLATSHERRGDAHAALRVLGERFPQTDGPVRAAWVEARARALAALGRVEGVIDAYETWRAAGGDPYEIRARYALLLSVHQLEDPEQNWIELLEAVIDDEDELANPVIHEAVYERLIGHYLVSGMRKKALSVYDAARERFELTAISREQLLRSANAASEASQDAIRQATLAFRLADGASRGTLLISPQPDTPGDTAYEAHRLEPGTSVRVERRPAVVPQRWVFRSSAGSTLASGTVWPIAGESTSVEIQAQAPAPRRTFAPKQRAADGRRRVFALVLDCADWRLVQYLRARGELPVLEHLLQTGYRAVLDSWPPLTATAMESLVWPTRGRQVSFLGLVHRLGIELAGLASVGQNPLEFLSAVLPEGQNLFETVGARELVAANMLFSHGMIDAGVHAELIGPGGRRRPAQPIRAFRPLTAEEREVVPDPLATPPRFKPLIEGIAAEFDAAVQLAAHGQVDLLLLRIEPLDILTHALYNGLTRAGQDDGAAPLLAAYRYIDDRLAHVFESLDGDDVLIVMSDHGIRSAMEHERDAIFVAVGEGVPQGRAPGTPSLRGVPRALAALFDIRTPWPDTGVARWAETGAEPTAHARVRDASHP
ncbi:MAG: alkaline phosphatase family protein [Deltaproteobacteria bacterium]|nr:MAG: alkaline phosphatase family protein [Deltaproteobacteria bacterium]